MINSIRSTDELEHIITNICKDDAEKSAIRTALNIALNRYQWQYQNIAYGAR